MEAELHNTADSTFLDAGYQLQWNRATLAPGETWTIDSFEYWSPPGSLQAFAPALSYVAPGTTVTKTFRVHNLDAANSVSVNLQAVAGSHGWPVSLAAGTPSTLNLEALEVEVDQCRRAGAGERVVWRYRRRVADGERRGYGHGCRPTHCQHSWLLDLAEQPRVRVCAPGDNSDLTLTLTNGPAAVDVTLGTIAALASPFTITNNGLLGAHADERPELFGDGAFRAEAASLTSMAR